MAVKRFAPATCPQLVLNYDNVVDILSIAQHLGLDDLQKNCEDFVARQLNLDNACLFLAAAMRMGQQFQGSSDNSFVERCAEYIEENAEECIHTESFLRLPKEALIRLVSSDQLALEENDVWRAVLAWAKQQTGINKPVSTWSEAEKGRVRVQMSGVIEHVKLLLIDSTVFAEEVEPTGAVPMEMSLERYRFAAVPDKVGDPHDKKLRPRLCVKLFHDTEILVRDRLQYQKQLSIWYGESKQAWKLIYRASRDGFSAQSFHTHCDGYCPTFIIVLGQRGNVCGGYSDVPWTSKAPQRGRYIASEKAFLFTLVNNQGVPPTKFGIANKKFATSHHPNFGPIFGAGADLCISSNCDTNMESYSNLPHSYTTDQASNSILMGDYNFTVADYEVFTICE